jgi:tetratricopeptide (TPR) repeat protein
LGGEPFTDRILECGLFAEAVSQQATASSRALEAVNDLNAPRRNVLVFHAMGGSGKSRLSRELQRRFEGGEYGEEKRRVSGRVDFDRQSADPEAILLRVRAALGRAGGKRSWPAFDRGLAAYWKRFHPHEPLDDFLGRDSSLEDVAPELIDQLKETAGEVFGSLLLARVARIVVSMLGGRAIRARQERQVRRFCALYEQILGRDKAEDMLWELAWLLAWDLARLQEKRPTPAVVFFDGWEEIQGQVRSGQSRSAESFLTALTFLMPTVLFVITGRERLDWGQSDLADALLYSGPACWPQLGEGVTDGRQHKLGLFDPEDCHTYLAGALSTHGEQVAPDAVVRRIVEGSAGLPLYLELSVLHFEDLVARGEPLEPEQFGGQLTEIVRRVTEDLDADERVLIRIAALLGSFDRSLLASGAPNIPDHAIERFLRRGFVRNQPQGWARYSLHASLSEAVRSEDRSFDAWSRREWISAAGRVLAALDALSAAATAAGDRTKLVECCRKGLDLAVFSDTAPEWLLAAFDRVAALGLASAVALPNEDSFGADTPSHALVQGFRGISAHKLGALKAAEDLLRKAWSSTALDDSEQEVFGLYLAHTLRQRGHFGDADGIYRQIAEGEGRYVADATRLAAECDYFAGRFSPARDTLLDLEDRSTDPLFRFETLVGLGMVSKYNGRFEEAAEYFGETVRVAESVESPALECRGRTYLSEALCWMSPDRALEEQERAMALSSRLGQQKESVRNFAVQAISGVQRRPESSVREALERSHRLAEKIDYRGGYFPVLAEVFVEVAYERWDDAAVARDRLADLTDDLGAYRFLLVIVDSWRRPGGQGPDNASPSGVCWLDTEADVKERWSLVLARRRETPTRAV